MLKSTPWEDIKKGDTVIYHDAQSDKDNKWKVIKVTLKGIWDGEKVQFDDEDNTLVRTTRWLHKENK